MKTSNWYSFSVFIFFQLICHFEVKSAPNDTLYRIEYYMSDTIKFEVFCYDNFKPKSIQRFIKANGFFIKSGYKYTFYRNGKLQRLELYRDSVKSSMLIDFDKRGRYNKFIGPGLGQDILRIIELNNNTGTSNSPEYIYGTADEVNGFNISYSTKNGNILTITEYNWIGNNPFANNGIQIFFSDKKISLIKNFVADNNIGENYYFKHGKLFMLVFSKPNDETGIRTKDIYQYLLNNI
jgi:hypothetical protein